MNLDELQSVQSRERQTDTLQQLRESFYEDVGEYVSRLREERDRAAERAADPFDSPEVNRLSDDINTAEQTVEALYERRVGKVVKMASLAAADMPTEEEGLTREERALFETLVDAIEESRDQVLDVLAGDASPGVVGAGAGGRPETGESTPQEGEASAAGEPTDAPGGVDAADLMGAGTDETPGTGGNPEHRDDPSAAPDSAGERGASGAGDGDAGDGRTEAPDVERRTVRITDDVGAILGVDEREYDLSSDDVVTLPAANADPLIDRDAAEPLE